MALQIYNTQTKKKEEFKPLNPPRVTMYVCGPTVYDFLHIGNFRGAVFFNLVRNWLEKKHGYKVTYVYNYTDVDDRIIDKANKEGKTSEEISTRYIEEFEKDFNSLGLRRHSFNPRVTEFMVQIVETIQKLIDNGKAYVANGEVLCSIEAVSEYGKLSGKNIEDLIAGFRVEVDKKKKNPLDFTLWKPAKPGEPTWPSPWGAGRPGWHIECTAMSQTLLGETIDIHGGGIDLIFPHHENEIAQSEGASLKPFVRYWMHNEFLNFGDQKMSKSLGNVITGRKFFEVYHPEIYKFMMCSVHYRKKTDFSEAQVHHAIAGLARIYSALALATEVSAASVAAETLDGEFKKVLETAVSGIHESLDDDFNLPEVMARIFEVVRVFNTSYQRGQKITPRVKARAEAFLNFVREHGELMALFQHTPLEFLKFLDDMLLKHKGLVRSDIDKLVADRIAARAAKDFAKSDELRGKLAEMGIAVSDLPSGTFWEVKK